MIPPYPGVRIKHTKDIALVQPLEDLEGNVPTLKIDLIKGSVSLGSEECIKTGCLAAPGILGVMKLRGFAALAVVKATEEVIV